MTAVLPAAIATLESPPGPKGSFLTGSLSAVRRDKLGFLTSLVREYGGVAGFNAVIDLVVVTEPDAVKHVLQDNHLNYVKGFNYKRLERLLGRGLLTSEGEEWRRNRRLAQPAFHRNRIQGFAELMVRHTTRLLERWAAKRRGERFDAHAEMMSLTLAIVGEALFSADVTGRASEIGRALTEALEITASRFETIFVPPEVIPTPENRRFAHARDTLDAMVMGLIAERRADGQPRDDLLAMLMEARFEGEDVGLSDVQLRDEVMTMVLAGHETTANALTWALYLLSTHPEVDRRLSTELAVIEGRVPTLADLPQLPFTKQVLEESMRLYPPAWAFGRRALEDDVIGGFRVKKGTDIMLFPYMTHRDARFWDNPEGFDPDRFAPEAAKHRHRFAYYPFAAGPRMCIGSAFAMMEMQLIMAMLRSRFRIDVVAGQRVQPEPTVTLRPSDGLWVTLTAV